MTPEERDRLTRVETKLDATMNKLESMEKSLDEMNLRFAKAGGMMIAFLAVGTFLGWVLTQLRNILGIFQ
jgi:hypothetical protein